MFNINKSLRENNIQDREMEDLEKLVRSIRDEAEKIEYQEERLHIKDKLSINNEKPKGCVSINDGAVEGIVNSGKSLYSAGIVNLKGEFTSKSIISICDKDWNEVSRGVSNFSSNELEKIIGKKSKEFVNVLGYKKEDSDAVVDRDHLILV